MEQVKIKIRQAAEKDLKIVQQFGYELLNFERENWDPGLDLNWPFSEIGQPDFTKKSVFRRETLICR